MDQSRRGVSLLACCALGLAWLGSCLTAYQYTERWAAQRALNERKGIAALEPGETVPRLREKCRERERERADLLRLIGYGGGSGFVNRAVLDQVESQMYRKIRGLNCPCDFSRWLPVCGGSAEDRYYHIGLSGACTRIRRYPDTCDKDELDPVFGQVAPTMEGVIVVLRAACGRAERDRAEVEDEVLDLRLRDLRHAVAEHRAWATKVWEQSWEVDRTWEASIEAAVAEKAAVEREISRLEKAIETERERGKKEIRLLNIKIRDANEVGRDRRRPRPGDWVLPPRRRQPTLRDLILDQAALDEWDGAIDDIRRLSINLGLEHQVFPGLRFSVFSYGAPGYLGEVEVTEVRETSSRVRVVRLADRRHPFAWGDQILNPLYYKPADRKRPLRLAFVGRFPTFERHRAEVSRRLAQMGVVVQDGPDHWTDLVVVEKDYDTVPEFRRTVLDLDAIAITVEDLRRFLAY